MVDSLPPSDITKDAWHGVMARIEKWTETIPDYWTGMLSCLEQCGHDVFSQRSKKLTRQYMDFPTGRGGVTIYLGLKSDLIQAGIHFQDTTTHFAHESFNKLIRDRRAIEREYGAEPSPLIWQIRTAKRAGVYCERQADLHVHDRSHWERCYQWQERHLSRFFRVFQPRVPGLPRPD